MAIGSDGTYPIRFFLLAAYLAAVLGTGLFLRTTFRVSSASRIYRWIASIASLSLISLFMIIGFWQWHVFDLYGIPKTEVAVFFSGDELSGTRVTHTHIGKVVIATAGTAWTSVLIGRADTGSALVPYVPGALRWLCVVLFALAFLSSLLVVPAQTEGVVGRRRQLIRLLLYGFVSFIVLDKSIDGGLLSDASFLVLCAFLALVWKPSRFLRSAASAALAHAWLLATLFALGLYAPAGAFLEAVVRSALVLGLLVVGYGASRNGSRRLRYALAFAVGISCLAYICVKYSHEWGYLHLPINDETYLSVYAREAQPDLPRIGAIGRLTVYAAGSLAPRNIARAIDEYALPYWYRPFSVPGTCQLAQAQTHASFTVLSPVPLTGNTQTVEGIARLSLTPDGSAPSGWYRYAASLSLDACIPRRLDVVREMLREAGSVRAIVYGLRYDETASPEDETGLGIRASYSGD
ncbi:MAG: hypothetical protein V4480_04630 [Patescibacteria group bacterium]